ncbi:hypothetical protein VB780_26455 [Leptolyngbya sp. CCNP1308]|uniref:hypothetical protein n=1 Tax=Leptolyngbya sp. CCNP1308 TaxID=3110255 RepID=UPI002B20874E|nr:hypothetical protein [Leptolyngbya sp. CCNP1308]MEA5452144.1 hypothetical protein [Leptolyngbya sp. CCNP1308]
MRPNRAEVLKEKYQNSVGLPFAKVLPEAEIQSVLDEQGITYRQVLYTLMVVLWSWISQVLDVDSSLNHAVNRVVAWMSLAGLEPPSADTGGYSKARKRLPESIFPPLLQRVAQALHRKVSPEQQRCGRRVKAFDATTVLMSDTKANQAVYPQHSNQKAGCGFPILKLQVWFCVTTGAVLEVAMAPFRVSEWHLCGSSLGGSDGSRCGFSQAPSAPLRFQAGQKIRHWRPHCPVAAPKAMPQSPLV